jgi:hypothetical protein
VSDEIVDNFPPIFELVRLLFGYRFRDPPQELVLNRGNLRLDHT